MDEIANRNGKNIVENKQIYKNIVTTKNISNNSYSLKIDCEKLDNLNLFDEYKYISKHSVL